jgi:hypothetical protein
MSICRGTEISFKEIDARSDSVALGILKLGFKPKFPPKNA